MKLLIVLASLTLVTGVSAHENVLPGCSAATIAAHPKWAREGGYCSILQDPNSDSGFTHGEPANPVPLSGNSGLGYPPVVPQGSGVPPHPVPHRPPNFPHW